MNIGIVGHEAAKFTPETEQKAKEIITKLLEHDNWQADCVVSGHCHLGGVDIYAEEVADYLGIPKKIFPPKSLDWHNGYRPRNIQIAQASDIVHVIVVAKLPETYRGMVFPECYHCHTKEHVKSGGCWTAIYAMKQGKKAEWHVIG